VIGQEVLTLDQSGGLFQFDSVLTGQEDANGVRAMILTGRTPPVLAEEPIPRNLLRSPDRLRAYEVLAR